jgi:hypothetical protein
MGSLRELKGQETAVDLNHLVNTVVKNCEDSISWYSTPPVGIPYMDHLKSLDVAILMAFSKIETNLNFCISKDRYIISKGVLCYLSYLPDFKLSTQHEQSFPCIYATVKICGVETSIISVTNSEMSSDSCMCFYLDRKLYPTINKKMICRLDIT